MPSLFNPTVCFRTLFLCCGLLQCSVRLASQDTATQKNLRNCLNGFGYCNHSLLSLSELQEVKVAEHQRNLQHCKTGYGYCDHSLLNADEIPGVKEAEHQRNLQHCKTGYGYDADCPNCGQKRSPSTVHQVLRTDALATKRLSDIGIPTSTILHVNTGEGTVYVAIR